MMSRTHWLNNGSPRAEPGKLMKLGTMADLRTGSKTLEDAYVRMVGPDHPAETLDWL